MNQLNTSETELEDVWDFYLELGSHRGIDALRLDRLDCRPFLTGRSTEVIIDQSQAHCYIYTGREGALSAIGHDLKIEVTKFSLTFDDGRVIGSFDTDSLRVLGAIEGGIVDKDELKSSDIGKIEKSIKKDVLQVKKYAKIRFEGEFEGDEEQMVARGELTLNGQTKSLEVRAHKSDDGWWQSRTTIDQTDWGMKPFKALLGQLRLARDIVIEVQMPPEIS